MSDDYEIGYKRPPQASRFKKGQSGNPRGRPKGARNLKTDLTEELQSPVSIIVQGKKKRISKQQAILMALTSRAIKGDPRSASIIIGLCRQLFLDTETDQGASDLPATDKDILAAFLKRHSKQDDLSK